MAVHLNVHLRVCKDIIVPDSFPVFCTQHRFVYLNGIFDTSVYTFNKITKPLNNKATILNIDILNSPTAVGIEGQWVDDGAKIQNRRAKSKNYVHTHMYIHVCTTSVFPCFNSC